MRKRKTSKISDNPQITQNPLSYFDSINDNDPFDWEEGLEDVHDTDVYSAFLDERGSSLSRFTPEVRLRIATLGDAIWCLQRKPRRQRGENVGIKANKIAARAWIKGECVSEPTFSFVEVCEIIGLEPDTTRKAIFKMVKKRRFDIRELVFWLK
ncbi:MAG: hypothetical protein ACO3L1_00025 [Flavobacteriaceae bacterium]